MSEIRPAALMNINEKTANRIIWGFSLVVFAAVVLLNRVKLPAPEGLDVHVFAKANAILNSLVTILLITGFVTAKARKLTLHRFIMICAITLSAIFLLSYITHHLFAGDTRYGGQGAIRRVYYGVLISHILLAAGSLPFILLTAYRGLSSDYAKHRQLAKRVWPVWLYVSVSGVIVYLMISPYY